MSRRLFGAYAALITGVLFASSCRSPYPGENYTDTADCIMHTTNQPSSTLVTVSNSTVMLNNSSGLPPLFDGDNSSARQYYFGGEFADGPMVQWQRMGQSRPDRPVLIRGLSTVGREEYDQIQFCIGRYEPK